VKFGAVAGEVGAISGVIGLGEVVVGSEVAGF
jgi:hypothetical protein